ncbi:hypothetical protein Nmel_005555 [Mimus melanotis]
MHRGQRVVQNKSKLPVTCCVSSWQSRRSQLFLLPFFFLTLPLFFFLFFSLFFSFFFFLPACRFDLHFSMV